MRTSAHDRIDKAHFDACVRQEVERILSEKWVTGAELREHFSCCTNDWLKDHGNTLPRVMVGNKWLYKFQGVRMKLIFQNKITN